MIVSLTTILLYLLRHWVLILGWLHGHVLIFVAVIKVVIGLACHHLLKVLRWHLA